MSLIEVIVAISILAVVFAGVLSFQFTLGEQRTDSLARITRAIAYSNIGQLVEGTPWDELATTTSGGQREWSLPRLTSGASNAPLRLADLRSLGIVSRSTGALMGSQASGTAVDNLTIYLEYFRSTANIVNGVALTTQPGLLDVQRAAPSEFKTELATNRANYLLAPTETLGFKDPNLLTAGNPILVRMVVKDGTSSLSRTIAENWFSAATSSE